jgi:hypothetical protein
MNAQAEAKVGFAGVVVPEGYVDLGPHQFNAAGICELCGAEKTTETYEEYVNEWYASEWEGERFHVPMDEVTWAYIRISCHQNDVAAEAAHEREIELSVEEHDRMLDAVDEWERESEADFIRRHGPNIL